MVYFILDLTSRSIKIGRSASKRGVQNRLRTLQIGNTTRLILLGTINDPNGKGESLETELHRKFAADRIVGEWFRPSNDVLTYIAENCLRVDPKLNPVQKFKELVEKAIPEIKKKVRPKSQIPLRYYNGTQTRLVDTEYLEAGTRVNLSPKKSTG